MQGDMNDLRAFVAVAKAGGFRQAARNEGLSPSRLSDALRRLEAALELRLLHRSTRSVVPTEAGAELLGRLQPLFTEMDSALDSVNRYRDKPAGKLRLNVPVSAARLILPRLVPAFLKAYPDIELEVEADSNVAKIVEAGFDAGIRYDELLEQDVVALPIGPRQQRYACAAAPALLQQWGRPKHPSDLLRYPCLRGSFKSGVVNNWEFQKGEELINVRPSGPLIVSIGGGVDLAVEAAVASSGVIYLFEEWLQPWLDDGRLEPILEEWWLSFTGPYLYYSGRKYLSAALRAFIDFIKNEPW